jgi:hypothetical protein
MIYVRSTMKTGSDIKKIMKGGFTDTQRARRSHKP